ncbi:glutaredoxin [Piromyces finnis]|uniref:Monothiol glutaredoxin-5, mitochondrial n=1 Tax=Piromyces finnis TaxID=1754191 RepID=A0A1Y1VKP6_9FUNG|nr:glutaredoxin [Piromyces finnis]|eukprot:ORX58651.1 glutaredoxin [Piromyces finnis]
MNYLISNINSNPLKGIANSYINNSLYFNSKKIISKSCLLNGQHNYFHLSTSSLISSSTKKTFNSLKLQKPKLFSRPLTNYTKNKIEKAIKSADLFVFLKGTPDEPECGFSFALVQMLRVQGVEDIKYFDVTRDPMVREGIKEYSNWPTIPQVYLKGEFLGGFDILYKMHKNGELEDILHEEGIVQEIEDEEDVDDDEEEEDDDEEEEDEEEEDENKDDNKESK